MGARIEDAFASALRVRPAVVVRRRDHPQPPGQRGAGRDAGRELRRGRVRAGLRRRRRRRAARRSRTCASSRAASGAASNPGERDLRRVLGGMLVQDYDSESEDRDMMTVVTQRTPTRARVGRPHLRLARRQARRLERHRDRQGPRHGRHRRRPDEPRRRRAHRAVARRSSRSRARRWRPTPSSRSTTGRKLALDAGVRSFIQPGGAKRDDDVITAVDRERGRRWSSPGAGTSTIDPARPRATPTSTAGSRSATRSSHRSRCRARSWTCRTAAGRPAA